MKISNRNCGSYVNERREFKANNIFSEVKNGVYIVYSYGYHFPIYAYKNNQWYGNKGKYSVTTSKHQSQSCPCDVKNIIGVDTKTLQNIENMSESELIVKS